MLAKNTVILVEPRELLRQLWSSWLATEFDVHAVADLTELNDTTASVAICPVPVVADLRHRNTTMPIVAIIDAGEVETLPRKLLNGYISTNSSSRVAMLALHLVMVGGDYFPDIPSRIQPPPPIPITQILNIHAITPAQLRVLNGVQMGWSNKKLAIELNISVSTVKAHVHAIMQKFGKHNRTELAIMMETATNG